MKTCATCGQRVKGMKPPAKFGTEHIGYTVEIKAALNRQMGHANIYILVAIDPKKKPGQVCIQTGWHGTAWIPATAIKRLY